MIINGKFYNPLLISRVDVYTFGNRRRNIWTFEFPYFNGVQKHPFYWRLYLNAYKKAPWFKKLFMHKPDYIERARKQTYLETPKVGFFSASGEVLVTVHVKGDMKKLLSEVKRYAKIHEDELEEYKVKA